MATFPSGLIPTGRTFTPGVFPHTAHRVLSGMEGRTRHSNTLIGNRLKITLMGLTTAEMLSVKAHYDGQRGRFESFPLSTDLLTGADTPATLTPTGHRWIYTSPPTVRDVPRDEGSPILWHEIEFELESVPPENAVAAGARWRVVAFWSPGKCQGAVQFTVVSTWAPGLAYGGAGGLIVTNTATWTPGALPPRGFNVTNTVTWAPGRPADGIIEPAEYFAGWEPQNGPWFPTYLPDWWAD